MFAGNITRIRGSLKAAKWLITSPTSFFEKWWSFISSTSKEIDAKKTFSFSQLRSGVDVIYFYAFSFADGRRILFPMADLLQYFNRCEKLSVRDLADYVMKLEWSLKQLLIYCLHLEVSVEICCAI